MSDLIVTAYPDEQRAAEVLRTLQQLQAEYLVDLEDAVYVTRDQGGKVRLHQAVNLTAEGAADGAFWGLLIGLILTLPFPFIAPVAWIGFTAATAGIGAAAGAIGGHFSDYGIDDQFIRNVSAQLSDNSSALFVLVRKSTPDKVLPEISKYGGTILRTSLSSDAEEKLRAALKASQHSRAEAPTPTTMQAASV